MTIIQIWYTASVGDLRGEMNTHIRIHKTITAAMKITFLVSFFADGTQKYFHPLFLENSMKLLATDVGILFSKAHPSLAAVFYLILTSYTPKAGALCLGCRDKPWLRIKRQ